MAGFTTAADLKQSLLQHCGELTGGTSPYDTLALDYLNRAYHALLAGSSEFGVEIGDPWPWAGRTTGAVALAAPYNTGTLTLTLGSTSGTFSAAPAASQAGKWLKVTDRSEWFKVSAHTAGATAFTLDCAYTDDSGSGLTYNLYELEKNLTGTIIRLLEPMRVYKSTTNRDGKLGLVSPEVLTARWPLMVLESGTTPTAFCIVSETNGTVRIRVNKAPSEAMRLEYDYLPMPTAMATSPRT